MRSYTDWNLPPRARDKFFFAKKIVESFPSHWEDKWLRCHEVARAVGLLLDLEIVDGVYGAVDHSWCMADTEMKIIIDPYAVGRLPPVQLVVEVPGSGFSPYVAREKRTDINWDIVKVLYSRGQAVLLEERF